MIAIVSNAVYDKEPEYVSVTDDMKERYCKKFGHVYIRKNVNYHNGRHPYFSKAGALMSAFESGASHVVWMDADAAPAQFQVDIGDWLEKEEQKVIMIKDINGWNNGVFAMPVNKRSWALLKTWDMDIVIDTFEHTVFPDQLAFVFAIENFFSDYVKIPDLSFGFNDYPSFYNDGANDGRKKHENIFEFGRSWCLHVPGFNNCIRAKIFQALRKNIYEIENLN